MIDEFELPKDIFSAIIETYANESMRKTFSFKLQGEKP